MKKIKISKSDKDRIKLFIILFVVSFILLGWFYVSFLLIINSVGESLVFSFKFLLGSTMLISIFMFLIDLSDKKND